MHDEEVEEEVEEAGRVPLQPSAGLLTRRWLLMPCVLQCDRQRPTAATASVVWSKDCGSLCEQRDKIKVSAGVVGDCIRRDGVGAGDRKRERLGKEESQA